MNLSGHKFRPALGSRSPKALHRNHSPHVSTSSNNRSQGVNTCSTVYQQPQPPMIYLPGAVQVRQSTIDRLPFHSSLLELPLLKLSLRRLSRCTRSPLRWQPWWKPSWTRQNANPFKLEHLLLHHGWSRGPCFGRTRGHARHPSHSSPTGMMLSVTSGLTYIGPTCTNTLEEYQLASRSNHPDLFTLDHGEELINKKLKDRCGVIMTSLLDRTSHPFIHSLISIKISKGVINIYPKV